MIGKASESAAGRNIMNVTATVTDALTRAESAVAMLATDPDSVDFLAFDSDMKIVRTFVGVSGDLELVKRYDAALSGFAKWATGITITADQLEAASE